MSSGDKEGKTDYGTPPGLFRWARKRWGPFDLDPAANDENHLTERYYTEREDGLRQSWSGRVFINPPYGNHVDRWIVKGCEATRVFGTASVCVFLIAARVDRGFFHDCVWKHAAELIVFRGRLRCIGGDHGAGFPSCIVVFRKSRGLRKLFSGPPRVEFLDWQEIVGERVRRIDSHRALERYYSAKRRAKENRP